MKQNVTRCSVEHCTQHADDAWLNEPGHKLANFHCFHFIDYIEDLFKKTTEICNQGGSHVREDSPSPLCKDYEKPDKSTAIQQHRSRFSK